MSQVILKLPSWCVKFEFELASGINSWWLSRHDTALYFAAILTLIILAAFRGGSKANHGKCSNITFFSERPQFGNKAKHFFVSLNNPVHCICTLEGDWCPSSLPELSFLTLQTWRLSQNILDCGNYTYLPVCSKMEVGNSKVSLVIPNLKGKERSIGILNNCILNDKLYYL